MFLYYNATLLKPLLVPLLEQQTNPAQFPYAAKDLGMLSSLYVLLFTNPWSPVRYHISYCIRAQSTPL